MVRFLGVAFLLLSYVLATAGHIPRVQRTVGDCGSDESEAYRIQFS